MSNAFNDYFDDSFDLSDWIQEEFGCCEEEANYVASCSEFLYEKVGMIYGPLQGFLYIDVYIDFFNYAARYDLSFDPENIEELLLDKKYIAKILYYMDHEELVEFMERIGLDSPRES